MPDNAKGYAGKKKITHSIQMRPVESVGTKKKKTKSIGFLVAEIGERLPFSSDAYFRRQCRNSLPIGCWAKRRHHHSFSFAADVQKRLDLQGVNGRQMQRLRRFVSPWLVLPMPIERTLLHSLLRLILLIDLSTPPSTHKVRQVSTFFRQTNDQSVGVLSPFDSFF